MDPYISVNQPYAKTNISVSRHVCGLLSYSLLTISSLALTVLLGFLGWNSLLTSNYGSFALFSFAAIFSLSISCMSIAKIIRLSKELFEHHKTKYVKVII